jgi:hypothetical protein
VLSNMRGILGEGFDRFLVGAERLATVAPASSLAPTGRSEGASWLEVVSTAKRRLIARLQFGSSCYTSQWK